MLEGQHSTRRHLPTDEEPAGLHLFTETINGTRQTAIYQMYDSGRVFARSVDRSEEHHDRVVTSWIEKARRKGLDVEDNRAPQ